MVSFFFSKPDPHICPIAIPPSILEYIFFSHSPFISIEVLKNDS